MMLYSIVQEPRKGRRLWFKTWMNFCRTTHFKNKIFLVRIQLNATLIRNRQFGLEVNNQLT